MPSTRSYTDVIIAVRGYMTREGSAEFWAVNRDLARELGEPVQVDNPGLTFTGQVRRALKEMTAAGDLVKVGRGQYHPGGEYEGNASWYTPVAYKDAQERAAQSQAYRAARAARWAAVHSRLTAAGIAVPTPPGEMIALQLEGWEELAGRLKR